jgi:hypothetical protein
VPKRVLLTGTNPGFGRDTVERLARRGRRRAITAINRSSISRRWASARTSPKLIVDGGPGRRTDRRKSARHVRLLRDDGHSDWAGPRLRAHRCGVPGYGGDRQRTVRRPALERNGPDRAASAPCCNDRTPWFTVVGVAKDVKQGGVDQETGTEAYFFVAQTAKLPLDAGLTTAPSIMNVVCVQRYHRRDWRRRSSAWCANGTQRPGGAPSCDGHGLHRHHSINQRSPPCSVSRSP